MNNFEFCNPVKVVFGKGSIARLSALLPEGSKVLVVYTVAVALRKMAFMSR